MIQELFLIFLTCLAFANAYFLHWQFNQLKGKNRKMFCLIGSSCEEVISSKFGFTLGIKNELGGVIFYVIFLILILTKIFIPSLSIPSIFLLNFLSSFAAIFSLYLLFIQAFVLKKFCSWCLIAISLNFAIFLANH